MTTALAEEWDWSLGDKPEWLADGEALLESCERTSTMPSPPPAPASDSLEPACQVRERNWARGEESLCTRRVRLVTAEEAATLIASGVKVAL